MLPDFSYGNIAAPPYFCYASGTEITFPQRNARILHSTFSSGIFNKLDAALL